jgi:hypothetical protein
VATGGARGSGTTAEIELDIVGSRGALKFQPLQASALDFQTGRQDTFQARACPKLHPKPPRSS